MTPERIIVVGGVIGLIGTALIIYGSFVASQQQAVKSDEIASLSRQLREKSDYTLAQLTGGDNFCRIIPGFPVGHPGKLEFSISNDSEFPLYDVQLVIVDQQKADIILKDIEKLPIVNRRSFVEQTREVYRVGNLSPHTGGELAEWSVDNTSHRSFTIQSVARNGSFTQRLSLRKVKNQWALATSIEGNAGAKYGKLFEKIDPNFPRTETGEPLW